jgi:hypothetical protein
MARTRHGSDQWGSVGSVLSVAGMLPAPSSREPRIEADGADSSRIGSVGFRGIGVIRGRYATGAV